MDPDELKKVGLYLRDHLDPDGDFEDFDDRDRQQKRELSVSRQGADKMAAITGMLDPVTKALWDVVAAKWAAAGMNNPNDPESPWGRPIKPMPTRSELQPHVMTDPRCSAIMMPSNGFWSWRSGRAHSVSTADYTARVIVTMTLGQLEKESGVATTASGGVVSVRDVFAAGRGEPQVLGVVGRQTPSAVPGPGTTLATADQRMALIAAERGCSRPGCDAPATEVAVRRTREWSKGGWTDITVLTLVCGPPTMGRCTTVRPGGSPRSSMTARDLRVGKVESAGGNADRWRCRSPTTHISRTNTSPTRRCGTRT